MSAAPPTLVSQYDSRNVVSSGNKLSDSQFVKGSERTHGVRSANRWSAVM